MTAQKDKALALLRQQVKDRRENFLRSFQPYPKQEDFANETIRHSELCLRAGNQQGKSQIGAVMMAIFLTGLYPDWWLGRRFERPVRAWACGESTVAVRDICQRKLCGPPGDEANFGTGAIPKSLLVGKILGHGAGGALDKIMVRHVSGGTSELTFKSYDQDRAKWQGESLDVIWCDEEPPIEHYLEALARLVATRGLIYSTFTPLNGLNGVLPRFREGNKDRILIPMGLDDALHLQDPEARARLLATFPEHQRKARIDGLPLLGSGAVFEDVDLANLTVPLTIFNGQVHHEKIGPLNTGAWAFLWGIDFGISHPFAAVLLGWDRDNDIIYALAELKIKGGVPAIHASRMRAIAGNVPVAWPHDGTQRDKGSGEQLASIYRKEGLVMLGQHATHPTGGFSTEAGIMDILARMRDGRFKIVGDGLAEWREEFLGYHRKAGLIVKANDDLLSATRIGVMQIRSARPAALGPARPGEVSGHRPRRGPEIAEGSDFDLFA